MADKEDTKMDMKSIIMLVTLLMGTNVATNAGQFLGNTRPAIEAKAEVTANSDFMRDELNACLAQLRECYAECAHSGKVHLGDAAPIGPLPPAYHPDRTSAYYSDSMPYFGSAQMSAPPSAEEIFDYESKIPYPDQMTE